MVGDLVDKVAVLEVLRLRVFQGEFGGIRFVILRLIAIAATFMLVLAIRFLVVFLLSDFNYLNLSLLPLL